MIEVTRDADALRYASLRLYTPCYPPPHTLCNVSALATARLCVGSVCLCRIVCRVFSVLTGLRTARTSQQLTLLLCESPAQIIDRGLRSCRLWNRHARLWLHKAWH